MNSLSKFFLQTITFGVSALAFVSSHAAITSNAITSNALTNNALTNNAITSNAITSNALTNNALTNNGLSPNGQPVESVMVRGRYTPGMSWSFSTIRAEATTPSSR